MRLGLEKKKKKNPLGKLRSEPSLSARDYARVYTIDVRVCTFAREKKVRKHFLSLGRGTAGRGTTRY